MTPQTHRKALIQILRAAYSGELGAAFAYRGHWKSVRVPEEIEGIRQIERDEWIHRVAVGEMLKQMGAKPKPAAEILLWVVGHVVGSLCHVTGWFFPMFLAGRLEYGNVDEYFMAAYHAGRLGLMAMRLELIRMAKKERDHEAFFMGRIAGHPLLPLAEALFHWPKPQRVRTQKNPA